MSIMALLEPTKTYAVRGIIFLTAEENPWGDTRDGTLMIELAKSAKIGAKKTMDTYIVEEREPKPGVMGRAFWVIRDNDEADAPVSLQGYTTPATKNDENDGHYITVIGPVDDCTCTAGRVKWHGCKHVDALRKVMEEGGLPVRQLVHGGGA